MELLEHAASEAHTELLKKLSGFDSQTRQRIKELYDDLIHNLEPAYEDGMPSHLDCLKARVEASNKVNGENAQIIVDGNEVKVSYG